MDLKLVIMIYILCLQRLKSLKFKFFLNIQISFLKQTNKKIISHINEVTIRIGHTCYKIYFCFPRLKYFSNYNHSNLLAQLSLYFTQLRIGILCIL